MLIYCSHLVVRSAGATNPVLDAVAEWLNRKTGAGLNRESLVDGFLLDCRDKQVIECATSSGLDASSFAIQLRHPDLAIPGRDWITDIGGRQGGSAWRCSVTLTTHEASRYGPSPEQTTRPQVVRDIIERCVIDSSVARRSTYQ